MKLGHQYNFIIFRVENYQQIVVCECGKANYDDFKSKFDTRECRYAVVEVPGTTKIAFISWTPDTASVKDRMTYASSRQGKLPRNIPTIPRYIAHAHRKHTART